MLPINAIWSRTTDEYLASLDMNHVPDPATIEYELLEKVTDAIVAENAMATKDRKYKIPTFLTNITIATLILALNPVRRIMWSGTEDKSNFDLAVYQTDGEDKGIYSTDKSALHTLIRKYNYNISMKDANDIIDMLAIYAKPCVLTSDVNLVAVNNGIFDYDTKELIDFSPDFVFTTKSRVNYNPKAKNVVIHNDEDNTDWDIESWMSDLSDDDEIVNLLWQTVGAIIRPNVPWNRVVCFYSETGNNGKGTLCQLMRNLCGKDNCASIPFAMFSHEFMLEQLTHVTSIVADENPTKSFTKEVASLKAVITGDYITINRKFKTPITIRFRGLMVQCINDLPKFGDKSESLYRRFLFVPFDKCFTGAERKYIKDDYLGRKEVLEYVLYRVLNSNFNSFTIPSVCNDLLMEYKEFNDPVRQFLADVLPQCVWKLLPWAFLYDLYKSWFAENCPSGTLQNKTSFMKDVKGVLRNNPDWSLPDKPVPTRRQMDDAELLISRYNLKNWKNLGYTGSDVMKICKPTLKSSYRGIVRMVANPSIIGPAIDLDELD